MDFSNIAFQSLYRNYEGDNTLGSSSETPMYLIENGTEGTKYYYIIANMPTVADLIERPTEWALWSMTAQPQPDTASKRIYSVEYIGDYSTYENCCKIITNESISISGSLDRMAIQTPLPRNVFRIKDVVIEKGTGPWNDTFCLANNIWKASDGKYYSLVEGYNSMGFPVIVSHHLFSADEPTGTWTDLTGPMNGDVLEPFYPAGYYGIHLVGPCFQLPNNPLYYAASTALYTNPYPSTNITHAIIIFKEDLSDVTVFPLNTNYIPSIQYSYYYGMTYYKGRYFYVIHDGLYNSGRRVCLVSDSIDGVYKEDSTIFRFSDFSDNSMFDQSVGGGSLVVVNNKLAYFSSGSSTHAYSGNYNNRESFLWVYDDETKEWSLLSCPYMMAFHGSGFGFTWGYDHSGSISNLFVENNRAYFFLNLSSGTNTYQPTLGYIDLSNFVIYDNITDYIESILYAQSQLADDITKRERLGYKDIFPYRLKLTMLNNYISIIRDYFLQEDYENGNFFTTDEIKDIMDKINTICGSNYYLNI